jgi:Ca2+-binding RTX toxin-like protein
MSFARSNRVVRSEALESRRMLSAVVDNGVLVVTGTGGADRIRVYEAWESAQVVVSIRPIGSTDAGEIYRVPIAGVRSVLVRAGAGDDVVDAYSSPLDPGSRPLTLPTRVDAGIGNDIVHGSRQRDYLYGGFGNDTIYGGNGDDWIDGGWGDDFLDGQNGNDVVSGNRGNDTVYGGWGDDRLSGGPGNDHVGFNGIGPLASEPGNDILSGGSGEDWMVGGSGTDRISGGTGRDHFALEDDDREILDRTGDEPKDLAAGV